METWYAFGNRLRIQGRGTVNRPAPRKTNIRMTRIESVGNIGNNTGITNLAEEIVHLLEKGLCAVLLSVHLSGVFNQDGAVQMLP